MNHDKTNEADKLLREIFATIPQETPSETFTANVMTNLSYQPIGKIEAEVPEINWKIWAAILFSAAFILLIILTSDFPLLAKLVPDHLLDPRLALKIPSYTSTFIAWFKDSNAWLTYIIYPISSLILILSADRLIQRKAEQKNMQMK